MKNINNHTEIDKKTEEDFLKSSTPKTELEENTKIKDLLSEIYTTKIKNLPENNVVFYFVKADTFFRKQGVMRQKYKHNNGYLKIHYTDKNHKIYLKISGHVIQKQFNSENKVKNIIEFFIKEILQYKEDQKSKKNSEESLIKKAYLLVFQNDTIHFYTTFHYKRKQWTTNEPLLKEFYENLKIPPYTIKNCLNFGIENKENYIIQARETIFISSKENLEKTTYHELLKEIKSYKENDKKIFEDAYRTFKNFQKNNGEKQ